MGPTRTLPPDRQAPPRTRRRELNDPLELDQPPTVLPELGAPPERLRGPSIVPDEAGERAGFAVDPLQPLGRRTPEPLEASREAVER